MRLSKEVHEQNLIQIRRLLVRNPNATIAQLCEATNFSIEYVLKLKHKVDRSLVSKGNHDLMRDIAKLEISFKELLYELWRIIQSKSASYSERVAAIRQVKEIQTKLLEAKFNAGLYERKLGTVDVNNMHTFLDMVMASSLSRNAKVDNQGSIGLLPTGTPEEPQQVH